MSTPSTPSVVSAPPDLDWEALYRALRLPRLIEEKMLRLIRQNRISKWFSGYGQEAIAVGCAWALEPEDTLLPMHRNLGIWTTRGVPLAPLFCQLMGKDGGYTNGRDRTFHFGLPSHNIVGMISQLGAMLPVACGFGLGAQLNGDQRVALAMIGDGATREGDFHEALNLAAVWKLPVLFVVENNGYGLSTPTSEIMAITDIADAAIGYGMPGRIVDGNDVLAVIAAVQEAAERARNGEGPTLLEMKTFRVRGHEEASGTKYVPPALIAAWKKKDPVERFTKHVLEAGHLKQEAVTHTDQQLLHLIDEAAAYALTAPQVESTPERERAALFATGSYPAVPPNGSASEKRFIDAISDGLRQTMEQDEKVLVMGQDIAEYGGVFKVTAGFLEAFGPERVRNTPIIESGALGAALGLALDGFKPVVEMQYGDFITCGFNQIVNNIATTHYRWGAPVNVTIRAPIGGHIGAGPFHSQSPEAWFCHSPGLKVVIPSTPEDAKGLLIAALNDPNPVLFFEHKYLYRSQRSQVPDAPYTIALGRAHVIREGTDATIITYGIGVLWALEEATYQAEQGYDVEVIDLRTLVPWDQKAVLASVRKTSRALVLHEAALTAGFGAEVVATIADAAFGDLDAPVVRVASEDLPVPFSINLEKEIYSARAKLRDRISAVLAY